MKKIKFNVLTFIAVIAGMVVFTGCDWPWTKKPITLSVSPTSLTFSAVDPQEQLVAIKTNANSWSFDATASWVIASQEGANLKVDAQNYTNLKDARTAVITVTAGDATPVTISVTQNPKTQDQLSCSQASLSFTAAAGSKSVTVTTTAASWNVSADKDWVTPTKSGNTLTINVLANTTTSDRISVVTVTAGDANPVPIAVTQAKADLSITLSKSSYDFGQAGGTTTVDVSSNVSWTASSNATSWLTVSPASGTNNGSLTLTAKANTSTSARSATITVSGSGITKTIAVTQGAPAPTYAQVRFSKTTHNSSNAISKMGIGTVSGQSFYSVAEHTFGTSTGTSIYYTVSTPGYYLPAIYISNTDGWYLWANDVNDTYNFQKGRKYTFEITNVSTPDSSGRFTMSGSISDDGAFNTSQDMAAPRQPGKSVQITLNIKDKLK